MTRRARPGDDAARHRRDLARRPAAAAQPPPDRGPRAAGLHPEGLSLEHLHALVYGDQAVTISTLKAEVSHLRSALGGQLASRPYRLTDAGRHRRRPGARRCSAAARSRAAVDAYGGDLLPGTNSPALTELAEYVAVAVREALLADPQPDAVLRYSELAPYDTEVRRGLPGRPRPAGGTRTPPYRCSRAGSPSPALSRALDQPSPGQPSANPRALA